MAKDWKFKLATVIGTTDEKSLPEIEVSNSRHIEVLPQIPGIGAEASAEYKKEFSQFVLKISGDEEYIKNFDPTRYNYAEGNITIEPKNNFIGTIHGWFISEDDRSTKKPAETNQSYGAYIETKQFDVSKDDTLKFGAGFRRGTLYQPTGEIYAVDQHKITKEKTVSAEVGLLEHPGGFIGVAYESEKIKANLRQYFYADRQCKTLLGQHDDKFQAQLEMQLNSNNSLHTYATLDEHKQAKLQQIMVGVGHDLTNGVSLIAEVGAVNSPDAPKKNLHPTASLVAKREF